MKSFFVFDVESVGLHGEAFAVAGGVYLENGAGQWEFCYACPIENCNGDPDDRKWVMENIPVIEETHRLPIQIRDAFWKQWMRAKKDQASMAVECGWPVEARFLAACVNDDLPVRKWDGPYPLHEIASFMESVGMNPMATYERSPSEMPNHHPLSDARLSARLLAEALSKIQPAIK